MVDYAFSNQLGLAMVDNRKLAAREALLVTVSAIALTVAVEGRVWAADIPQAPVAPAVSSPAETWIAVEGAWNRFDGDTMGESPTYYPGGYALSLRNTDFDDGWGAALEVGHQPGGSLFDYVGRVRFRTNDGNSRYSYPGGYYYGPGYSGASRKIDEDQIIVDFEVGRDLGIGSYGQTKTRAHFGVRFAHFDANSNTQYPTYYGAYSYGIRANSKTWGIGPRIGINSDIQLGESNFMLELDLAGALLFGKRDSTSRSTYGYVGYQYPVYRASNDESVVIPNLEAAAAISYLFGDNLSASLGYRFDGYWNAVEQDGFFGTNDGNRFVHEVFLRGTYRFEN